MATTRSRAQPARFDLAREHCPTVQTASAETKSCSRAGLGNGGSRSRLVSTRCERIVKLGKFGCVSHVFTFRPFQTQQFSLFFFHIENLPALCVRCECERARTGDACVWHVRQFDSHKYYICITCNAIIVCKFMQECSTCSWAFIHSRPRACLSSAQSPVYFLVL